MAQQDNKYYTTNYKNMYFQVKKTNRLQLLKS